MSRYIPADSDSLPSPAEVEPSDPRWTRKLAEQNPPPVTPRDFDCGHDGFGCSCDDKPF